MINGCDHEEYKRDRLTAKKGKLKTDENDSSACFYWRNPFVQFYVPLGKVLFRERLRTYVSTCWKDDIKINWKINRTAIHGFFLKRIFRIENISLRSIYLKDIVKNGKI